MIRSDIKTICKKLFDEFQGRLSWKWDDWTGTILAEFDAAEKAAFRSVLEKFLPIAWDGSNIKTAPSIVQGIEKNLGGLRSGQLLFSSDPIQEDFVFCAWWPWGSGKTISIRISFFNRDLSEEEEARLTEELKSFAGIQPAQSS